jgi:uncharacterized phage infection (PIP) family protein YhgE
MSAFTTLLSRREARAALAAWMLVPALFLFFNVTLAVDPAANLDRLEIGAVVADTPVATPQGEMAIGPRLLEGLGAQLGAEITTFETEADLRDAVLAREVIAGIVIPAGTTASALAGEGVELEVVRSEANDPFSNAFTANLAGQLSTNLNAALPQLLPGAEPPAAPMVSVASTTVASTADFRFAAIIGALLLPLWVGGLAFAGLVSRAGDAVRHAVGTPRTIVSELALATIAAAAVAAVLSLGLATFAWNWEIDVIGLFGVAWLGLTAIAWLLLGLLRAVGLELGALLGVLALFVQQPVSGAAFPSAMAPDAVRWAEPFAPLRHLVEGVRNVLIGGSTTPDVLMALTIIGLVGLALAGLGAARLSMVGGRRESASVQPA